MDRAAGEGKNVVEGERVGRKYGEEEGKWRRFKSRSQSQVASII